MSILLFAEFLGVVGKVMLGIAVYRVHGRVVKEHKIDEVVLKEMQGERSITLIGMILIILDFLLQLPHFLNINLLGLYAYTILTVFCNFFKRKMLLNQSRRVYTNCKFNYKKYNIHT